MDNYVPPLVTKLRENISDLELNNEQLTRRIRHIDNDLAGISREIYAHLGEDAAEDLIADINASGIENILPYMFRFSVSYETTEVVFAFDSDDAASVVRDDHGMRLEIVGVEQMVADEDE